LILKSCNRVDDRRQRLVVDLDLLRGVERLRERVGDDQRDRLADVGDLLLREERRRVNAIERLQLAQQLLRRVRFAGDADRRGFPGAWALRTNTASSVPGWRMSARKRPSPLSRRSSSTRLSGWPIQLIAVPSRTKRGKKRGPSLIWKRKGS
jgi:hypothetical protein